MKAADIVAPKRPEDMSEERVVQEAGTIIRDRTDPPKPPSRAPKSSANLGPRNVHADSVACMISLPIVKPILQASIPIVKP